ncbi:MAG: hypothetical protein OSJ54_06125 [Oscillospiraceae bacterium]|nr:hypothetical protein [Oscillospiraceae bacterium]
MNKFRDALSASLSNFAAEIKKKYCHVQENVVEEIKVNGTAQTVSDKSVNISVPTNVSELANDSKYQTDEQVAAIIAAKVSSTYKAGGSAAFENLPELTESNLGLVVNVTEKFITTDNFVEGAGAKHPAGTNVVVVNVGEEYKYDVLAGFVDLADYATTADIAAAKSEAVTQANLDTSKKLAEYVKLTDIEEITESEIAAMLAD